MALKGELSIAATCVPPASPEFRPPSWTCLIELRASFCTTGANESLPNTSAGDAKPTFPLLFGRPAPKCDDLSRDFLKTGTIQNDGFMNMGSCDLIELRDPAVVFIPRNAFIAIILCHKRRLHSSAHTSSPKYFRRMAHTYE